MAELRDYKVTVNGIETVMSLDEEDAQRLGGTPAEGDSGTSAPASKARQTSNKSRSATE